MCHQPWVIKWNSLTNVAELVTKEGAAHHRENTFLNLSTLRGGFGLMVRLQHAQPTEKSHLWPSWVACTVVFQINSSHCCTLVAEPRKIMRCDNSLGEPCPSWNKYGTICGHPGSFWGCMEFELKAGFRASLIQGGTKLTFKSIATKKTDDRMTRHPISVLQDVFQPAVDVRLPPCIARMFGIWRSVSGQPCLSPQRYCQAQGVLTLPLELPIDQAGGGLASRRTTIFLKVIFLKGGT